MSATRYDVIGIGNAIVDVLSHSDDDFLARQKMPKGSMSLIDEKRAEAIYNAMGPVIECSGGSAANTLVGARNAKVMICPQWISDWSEKDAAASPRN
mgnify:CR=1 FL=1